MNILRTAIGLYTALFFLAGCTAVTYSPDVAVALGGATVNDENLVQDNAGGTTNLLRVKAVPGAADLNAYHELPNGDRLVSFDITVNLGGLTVDPGDVARYDGTAYTMEFDSFANGLPSGVVTDAVSTAGGDLLLSFDTTVTVGGVTADDEDIVRFDGAIFSLFFDGSQAGISPGLDLDGVHYQETSGNLFVSFSGSGAVGGVTFDDEDVLEYDRAGGTWRNAYDVSRKHASWGAADLDALHLPAP